GRRRGGTGRRRAGGLSLAAQSAADAVAVAAAGALSAGFAAGASAPPFASDLPPPSPLSARLRFVSPSFLKSVSYQPLPARRNAGAVRRRDTWPPAPQDGQVSGSGSDSFCR